GKRGDVFETYRNCGRRPGAGQQVLDKAIGSRSCRPWAVLLGCGTGNQSEEDKNRKIGLESSLGHVPEARSIAPIQQSALSIQHSVVGDFRSADRPIIG